MSKKKRGCLLWFLSAFDANKDFEASQEREAKENKPYIFPDQDNVYSQGKKSSSLRTNTQTVRTNVPIRAAEPPKEYKYRRKYLLTKNELYFYKELKRIADKLNLTVLAKIRMADLVEPKSHGKDYYGEFGKIKAKHVDFALCNPDNLYVLLLIEVDDNSHDTKEGTERDEFVEAVYKSTGYTLYRARGTANLERDITEIIDSQK